MIRCESNRAAVLALTLANMPCFAADAGFEASLPRTSFSQLQQDPTQSFAQYGAITQEFVGALRNRIGAAVTAEQVAAARGVNLSQPPITILPPAADAIETPRFGGPTYCGYLLHPDKLKYEALYGIIANDVTAKALSSEMRLLVALGQAKLDLQLTAYRIDPPVVENWHGKYQANYFVIRDGKLQDIDAIFFPTNSDVEIQMWRGRNPHPTAGSVDGKDVYQETRGRPRIAAAVNVTMNGERSYIGSMKYDSAADMHLHRSQIWHTVTYRRAPVCDEIPGVPQGGNVKVSLTPRGRREVVERNGPLSDTKNECRSGEIPRVEILGRFFTDAKRSFEPAAPAHAIVQAAAAKVVRESFPVLNQQTFTALEAEIQDPNSALGAAAAKLNTAAEQANAEAVVLAFRSAVTLDEFRAKLGVGEGEEIFPSTNELLPRLRKTAQAGGEATWIAEYEAKMLNRVESLKAKATEAKK